MNDSFDEIMTRFVETGQLYQQDIIPVLAAYSQEFGDGNCTGEQLNVAAQFLTSNPFMDVGAILNKAIKRIGIKRGYQWVEVIDVNGQFKGRYWNKPNEE